MATNERTPGSPVQPVKIVLQRRPRLGAEREFDAWVRALVDEASKSPALQGSSVLATPSGEHFILLRFASQTELERWNASSEVSALLRRGDDLAIATDQPVQRSGLETWFTLPGTAVPNRPPPKWKMALVTWLALLPQALLLGLIIPKTWPRVLGTAVGTGIPVMVLTWIAMPNLTRLLYRWLYRGTRGAGGSTSESVVTPATDTVRPS